MDRGNNEDPRVLAILFQVDKESGARSVYDIIRVMGADKNVLRRLRRAVTNVACGTWVQEIQYEEYANGGREYTKKYNVTKRYKAILGD